MVLLGVRPRGGECGHRGDALRLDQARAAGAGHQETVGRAEERRDFPHHRGGHAHVGARVDREARGEEAPGELRDGEGRRH